MIESSLTSLFSLLPTSESSCQRVSFLDSLTPSMKHVISLHYLSLHHLEDGAHLPLWWKSKSADSRRERRSLRLSGFLLFICVLLECSENVLSFTKDQGSHSQE